MSTSLPKLIMGRNGRWLLTRAEKDPVSGKWATRTTSTHTAVRAEAEAFRRRFVGATLKLGPETSDPDGGYLLAELLADYAAELRHRGAGRTDQRAIPNIAKSEIGGLRASELTPDVIQAWCRGRGRLSNATIRRDLATIHAALVLAVKAKKLKAEDKPHISMPKPPPARDRWLDEDEEQRLWNIASNDVDANGHLSKAGAFICLALSTGARREAIMELTWDRIDFRTRQADFNKPGRPVTNKKRPISLINNRLMPVLIRMRQEWQSRMDVDNRVIAPIMHGSSAHGWPRMAVEHLLRSNRFKGVTPHVFRHTFITLNLRAGVSMWDVGMMAAVSPIILNKHYAHHAHDARLMAEANKRFAA